MGEINAVLRDQKRTSVFIAHRFVASLFPLPSFLPSLPPSLSKPSALSRLSTLSLRTVSDADHIIVLHAGAVAEQGTHEELLALEGLYYDLWLASLDPAPTELEGEVVEGKSGDVTPPAK